MTVEPADLGGGCPATYYRAVAVDIDGTIAENDRVSAEALAALRHCRDHGVAVIVVTGRTVADVRRHFAVLLGVASTIVAENGACLMRGDSVTPLAAPLDPALGQLLSERGVPWSTGEILLACSGNDEPAVLDVIRELGYEYELIRNRAALMVLPAGVTKGSGLVAALAELRLSPHSTIAVGDAENDHSLLESSELGAAVANAVDSLKARADLVLEGADGTGVASLLSGSLLAGKQRVHSKRWRVVLGTDEDGSRVSIPASQLNVIIAGDSGDGKSYLAGLIAEQLVVLGYSVVALDPEGDHTGLSRLAGVSVLDARVVQGSARVLPLLVGPGASAVVDLSGLDSGEQRACLNEMPAEIEAMRSATGLPHWVVVDEAHRSWRGDPGAAAAFEPAGKGHLLVTWQPGMLPAEAVAGADVLLALGGARPSQGLVDLVAAASGVERVAIAGLLEKARGWGLLVDREHRGTVVPFRLGERRTAHLRHEHKYETIGMEGARRFHFRTLPDVLTGRTACNLIELEAVLAGCDQGVFRHHCPKHDFSRWIAQVLRDQGFAEQIAAIEAGVGPSSPDAVVEDARIRMIAALHSRALGDAEPSAGAGHREAAGSPGRGSSGVIGGS